MRDAAAHLPEAIASLRSQTLEDFEVLAVDDGSRDATPEILQAWAARDRRVRVRTQEPQGIVAALERARGEARGRFLARMDGDDVADPGRLAAQRDLMDAEPSLAGCGCQVRYFPRDRVREGALRYERWLNAAVTPEEVARAMFVECPLAHPAFFLRSEAVAAVGGYRDEGWPEDYDLVLRLWAGGHRLANVPEVLLKWREGPDRLSRIDPSYSPRAFRRCKVHWLARTLARDRAVVVWGAGPVGKAFARECRRQGVRVAAFSEVDPRKIGQEIHGAPVLDARGALALQEGVLHLAAVGQAGARALLRDLFGEAGLTEGREWVAVA